MIVLLAALATGDGLQRITLALVALGTFLGFVNLLIKIIEVWRDRSSLRFSLTSESVPVAPLSSKELTEYISLKVTNGGRRPVQVLGVGLLFEDGQTMPAIVDSAGHSPFPVILDERNRSATASYKFLPLNQRLTEEGQARLSRLYCSLGTGERKTARIRGHWMKTLTV